MRVKASLAWPNSVCMVRRNFRRTGVLKKRLCTSTDRAHRAAAGRRLRRPPAGDFDLGAAGAFGRAASQHQPAHFGDRGQRLAAKPQRADAKQVVGLVEVCWWRGRPRPAAVRRPGCRRRCRPRGSSPIRLAWTATSMRVAPASTAFSINSLTTLAGRSTTSPAAILLIRDWERRRIGMGR